MFFFSSRRRHTSLQGDWSSDVCSSDLDPDVIMLGEIRDRPSMETVLKAADTGHMVMSTLHTTVATQTINRIISFFPPHRSEERRVGKERRDGRAAAE